MCLKMYFVDIIGLSTTVHYDNYIIDVAENLATG